MFVQRMLLRPWWPDMPQIMGIAGAVAGEVLTSVEQAQTPVRSAAHPSRVVVVLPVVLPEADRADAVAASLVQRQIPTTRTRVRPTLGTSEHVYERPVIGHATQSGTPVTGTEALR
ncbi:hypothetical protein GCM10027605_66000 [Micromonospora zhanjiangensis]